MADKVYKAGNGWVRQFEDGSIVGPFETRDLADNFVREEKVTPKAFKDEKNYGKNE